MLAWLKHRPTNPTVWLIPQTLHSFPRSPEELNHSGQCWRIQENQHSRARDARWPVFPPERTHGIRDQHAHGGFELQVRLSLRH